MVILAGGQGMRDSVAHPTMARPRIELSDGTSQDVVWRFAVWYHDALPSMLSVRTWLQFVGLLFGFSLSRWRVSHLSSVKQLRYPVDAASPHAADFCSSRTASPSFPWTACGASILGDDPHCGFAGFR